MKLTVQDGKAKYEFGDLDVGCTMGELKARVEVSSGVPVDKQKIL